MGQIDKVAVIGAGTMGAQIASLTALSGYTVALWDATDTALANGMDRAESEIFPKLGARRALDPADCLVVEHDHLAAHGDGAAGERQQRHVHIVLPQVAYEVDLV